MSIASTLRQYLSSLSSSFSHFSSGLWQLFPKSIFSFHLYPPPNLPCTEATTLLLKPSNNSIKYSSLLHIYFLKHPSSPVISPNSFTCQRFSMIWSFLHFPPLSSTIIVHVPSAFVPVVPLILSYFLTLSISHSYFVQLCCNNVYSLIIHFLVFWALEFLSHRATFCTHWII